MVESLAGEILHEGLDDWVPLLAVSGRARSLGSRTGDEVRDVSLQAIRALVVAGLVEIGEVFEGTGFCAWDEDLDTSLERVRAIWETTEPERWGFAVWVSNTPAGNERASCR
jgi:hypothetical protein